MRRRSSSVALVFTLAAGLITALGPPASADHTTPQPPLSPNNETTQVGVGFGIGGVPALPGTWTHVTNFPPNPGSDFALFTRVVGATRELYASSGTLGGGDDAHVGQRITRLTSNNQTVVDPTWIADHGSANCPGTSSTGNLGLQHDAAVAGAPRRTSRIQSIPRPIEMDLLIDATDANGRCHDSMGGGLELIDITNPSQPKEIHLIRHAGTSHTVTVDARRPWIVYNSTSDFAGRPWIDVLDVRTCVNLSTRTLAEKRAACRPKVFRMPFQPSWTFQRNFYNGGGAIDPTAGSAACHDITAIGTRLYCAAIRASLILDVANLTDANGNIRGTQMPCPIIATGTMTTAAVTNCSGQGTGAPTVAPDAFQFLGTRNHAGIDCTSPPAPRNSSCNSNLIVPVNEDIAISHEADPTHDERVMFATDERGGGVVPPGASCTPGGPTNFSNGGMHAFDISGATPGRDPADNFPYMLDPAGNKAVFLGAVRVPAASFCTIHMVEHAHDEQRLFVAYYSQGVKVVDYFFHPGNRISFRETASFILPNANTWVAHQFKTVNNGDGTNTYYLLTGDIQRGIDVISYRAAPNPIGAPPPAEATATIQAGNAGAGLLVLLAALPATALLRRRRRSRS
jgi:hypothetical protein